MDARARWLHLQDLLSSNAGLRDHLNEHAAKLESHHQSRERDRALLQTRKSLRRAEKLHRSLERAIRNEEKIHPRK